MEDDKEPATPRKPAAEAKPNDVSDSSAAAGPTGGDASRRPRAARIPPATFVPPVAPPQGADAPAASAEPPRKRPAKTGNVTAKAGNVTAAGSPQAKTPTRKTARKAAKKAAGAAPTEATPATSLAPPATTPTPPTAGAPSPQAQPAADEAGPAAPQPEAAAKPVKKATKAATKAAAKATPPTATTPAEKTQPAVKTQATEKAEPPRPVPRPPAPLWSAPPSPTRLWSTIKATPGYAAELLALAAVEHLGPQSRTHLAWLRDTYPTATINGLARIAASQGVRQARTQGAVAGLLGPVAVLAQTAALLWTQARMALDIAAAYGRDPADPERAVELLMLQGVHPDLATAREAVATARETAARTAGDAGNPAPQVTLPVARVAGRALLRTLIARRASRLVPGAGAVLTAVLDARASEQLAARAMKFYGRSAQER
ncbi:EcsC family protein [Planosporangium thailandense]|uniref:EcsC family protein n=1 Tax=Planosporangium thailandense TaxID=765197 RepID=A0ABX0XSZ7_9ACTN|nr:EcsC family protein [Planosporangium thailandense]NJC69120.1 EcsC family protein [Planosporangium thailandense]